MLFVTVRDFRRFFHADNLAEQVNRTAIIIFRHYVMRQYAYGITFRTHHGRFTGPCLAGNSEKGRMRSPVADFECEMAMLRQVQMCD